MTHESFDDAPVEEGAGVEEMLINSTTSESGFEVNTRKLERGFAEQSHVGGLKESEKVYSGDSFEDKYWENDDGRTRFRADIVSSATLDELVNTIEDWGGVPRNDANRDYLTADEFRSELKKLTDNINETALEHGISKMAVINEVKAKLQELLITPRPMRQAPKEYRKIEAEPVKVFPQQQKNESRFSRMISSFASLFKKKTIKPFIISDLSEEERMGGVRK